MFPPWDVKGCMDPKVSHIAGRGGWEYKGDDSSGSISFIYISTYLCSVYVWKDSEEVGEWVELHHIPCCAGINGGDQ